MDVIREHTLTQLVMTQPTNGNKFPTHTWVIAERDFLSFCYLHGSLNPHHSSCYLRHNPVTESSYELAHVILCLDLTYWSR
jgi:hypothetical protein